MNQAIYDNIFAICRFYADKGCFVGTAIPQRKLRNAHKTMNIPAGEQVIGFVDCTVLGSGKHGLAICMSGLYWHNDWTTPTAVSHLDWEAFRGVDIGYVEKYKLGLGEGNYLNTAACSMKPDDVVSMLKQMQTEVNKTQAASNPDMVSSVTATPPHVPQQTEEWWLAVDGQQYGPYAINVIGELLGSGQVVLDATFAWKSGMAAWAPVTQIPDLAALAGRTAVTPLPPPPPGSQEGQSVDQTIDINTASYEELVELLGFRTVDARRIIQDREAIGGFQTAEQVGELIGLKPHQVRDLKRMARFSPVRRGPGHGRLIDY